MRLYGSVPPTAFSPKISLFIYCWIALLWRSHFLPRSCLGRWLEGCECMSGNSLCSCCTQSCLGIVCTLWTFSFLRAWFASLSPKLPPCICWLWSFIFCRPPQSPSSWVEPPSLFSVWYHFLLTVSSEHSQTYFEPWTNFPWPSAPALSSWPAITIAE